MPLPVEGIHGLRREPQFARWLSRSPGDADDVVQEAILRAFRGFDGPASFRCESVATDDHETLLFDDAHTAAARRL
jgi:hypothetical protein